jgi:hypothetical protein
MKQKEEGNVLNDGPFVVGAVRAVRGVGREATCDGVVVDHRVSVITVPRVIVDEVDASQKDLLSIDRQNKAHEMISRAHVLGPNRIVFHQCSRGAKQYDSPICGTSDEVVRNNTVPTRDADPVGPLLESVGSTGTNVVIANGSIGASQSALLDMQAGPATRVVRADVFDELIWVIASHLDVRAAFSRWGTGASTIDLVIGTEFYAQSAIVWRDKRRPAYLNVTQPCALTVRTRSVDRDGVSCAIHDRSYDDKGRSIVACRISERAYLLVRSCEQNGRLDHVLPAWA